MPVSLVLLIERGLNAENLSSLSLLRLSKMDQFGSRSKRSAKVL
jgi:hypothetical protein